MKHHIGYNLAILFLGLAELACILLLVLSVLPAPGPFGLEVEEPLTVSSSQLEDGKSLVQLQGRIITRQGQAKRDQTLYLDAIEILIGNGKDTKTVVLKEPSFAPRLAEEIFVETEESIPYDRVLSVTVVKNGERYALSNSVDSIFKISTLISGFLAVVFALLLTHFIKQRYYLSQETH